MRDQQILEHMEGVRALMSVQGAWNAGAAPWDTEALTAVYTNDAVFFGGRPGHSVGRDAIREYFASYEGVIESAVLVLVDQHVAQLGADLFFAQGYGDFSFVLAGDQHTRSLLRTTLIIVRDAVGWKIRQQHVSPSPSAPPLGITRSEWVNPGESNESEQ